METSELEELRQVALSVALEAAALILQRPADLGVSKTKSTSTDVVTVMDQRAQDLLRARLHELRPQDGFFGEEEGGTDATSTITWVVDPIDGTVNYLYDIPSYAVSVAAVLGDPRVPGGWQPVAGAVVNPCTGEAYHAHEGGGSVLEEDGASRTLELTSAPPLAEALVGTGFGYAAARRAWQARLLVGVLPHVRDIRRIGSAALDICAVASGRLDGYYERGLNPWDMAAAWLVLTEAGGSFTGLDGQAPDGTMCVGGHPVLHQALLDVLEPAAAAAGSE